MLEAHAAGVSAMLAAAAGVEPEERERRELEQLRERYAGGRIDADELERETGRILGIPEPEALRHGIGPAVHAAVVAAGVVGLLVRWRRPGSRWVL